MAERATAQARRTSSQDHPKPAPRAHRPPPPPPDRAGATPGATSSVPTPHQPPVSAHLQQMPRYCRPHGPQSNLEAESVSAYPRVRVRLRPTHSPCTATAQDYEDSPRPTAAARPHDSNTHTHAQAHTHAQGHGPARGSWWQRWTHTKLRELLKWTRAEPFLKGLVHRPRRESAENCRLQPAGRWMPQDAWEAMQADAVRPHRVHPRELPAPQDHPYVLRCLRETLQDAVGRKAPMGHHRKPTPTHGHPLATPQTPMHGLRQHRQRPDPQHPGNPARYSD